MNFQGDLCSEVDAPEMFRHLEEFARHIKLSGSPAELQSFQYLRFELTQMGFETNLLQHDAYISLPGQSRLIAGGEQVRCITHSFSQSSGKDGLTGSLVYVGRGREEDFASRDLSGSIVLVEGLPSPDVCLRAGRAGAVGQVHISADEYRHEMCISPVWGSPSAETATLLPSTVVVTVSNEDGQKLKSLPSGTARDVTLHAEVDTGWRKIPLLVAEMARPGAGSGDPFVLFSGHHDTWYYGVMDNGAANATMLEAARILSSRRSAWQRGLRLCFWSGHSHGRYAGSSWYADHHWHELSQRCVAHVNVDSTGGRGQTIVSDMPACAELRRLAAEAVREQGRQEFAGMRLSRAGDQSFWGVGIPSLFMTAGEKPAGSGENVTASLFGGSGRKGAGFGWWWHTEHDTIDKIDPELLVRDTRIYVHALWRLLCDLCLPLDYSAFGETLVAQLRALQGKTGNVDLSTAVALAERLRHASAALETDRENVATPERARQINEALVRVSRLLVPMDYTSGDRFEQDPASAQPPFPVLEPVRKLAAIEGYGEEARFQAVSAVRAVNRLCHALSEAVTIVEDCTGGTA